MNGAPRSLASLLPALIGASVKYTGRTDRDADVAFGLASINDGGQVEIQNVPIASAGTYDVGAFWMDTKLGIGTRLTLEVTEGGNIPVTVNFNSQEAITQERTQSTQQTQQQIQNTGTAGTSNLPTLRGYVMDESSLPVANAYIHVWGDYLGGNDGMWQGGFYDRNTRTDSNGVYSFYGLADEGRLSNGCTLYVHVSANAQGYEGVDLNGMLHPQWNYYIGYKIYSTTFTTYVSFMSPDSALIRARGVISGYITLGSSSTRTPLPYGSVNVQGDNTRWGSKVLASTDTGHYEGTPIYDTSKGGRGGGRANINNGKFIITDLPKGNYRLTINSDFSQNSVQFNDGANKNSDMTQINLTDGVGNPTGMTVSLHTFTGDDIRITINNNYDCGLWTSTGCWISTSVIVNIPAESASGGVTGTISGKITLVGAVNIPVDGPITIIARQDYSSYNSNGSVLNEQVIVTAYGGGVAATGVAATAYNGSLAAILAHKNINSMNVLATNLTGNIIYYESGPTPEYWVDSEGGKIVWTAGALTKPTIGEVIKVSYQYMERPKTGFTTLTSASAGTVTAKGKEYTYQITVPNTLDSSTTNTFRIQIETKKLGISWTGGDITADLSNSAGRAGGTATVPDLVAMPAGTIKGIVKKPNGELFVPYYGPNDSMYMRIEARGQDVETGNGTDVKDDGTFEINGVIPGTYQLVARTQYNGDTARQQVNWADTKMSDVLVSTIAPTNVVLQLKEGIRLMPNINMAPILTQELIAYFYTNYVPNSGSKSGLAVVGFPTGTSLAGGNLMKLLMTEPEIVMGYNYGGSQNAGENLVAEGNYDLYALANSDFDKSAVFTTFMAERKKVIVDKLLAATTGVSGYMIVSFPEPAVGNATLTGRITGLNVITQKDVPIIQNTFMKILNYVPAITFYDANGRLAGFAPALGGAASGGDQSDAEFKALIAEGNLAKITPAMQDLMSYTIKFLKPGTYTIMVYNPNYPLITKTVTLAAGANTLSINLDNDAGAGATISGTITDLANSAVKIAGASIVVRAKGTEKTATSDSSGNFSVERLNKGVYTVEVSATGYAPAIKKVATAKVGTTTAETYTANFELMQAGETLSGTVYISKGLSGSKIPSEPVKIIAFDNSLEATDKKALLPLLYGYTETSSGTYSISGVINDHTYTMAILVPGNKIEAVIGVVQDEGFLVNNVLLLPKNGIDFILKYLPPSFESKQIVRTKTIETDPDFIDFSIKSLKALKESKPTISYSAGTAYSAAAKTDLVVYDSTGTANTWTCSVPMASLDSSSDYTMRVFGTDSSPNKSVYLSTEAYISFGAKFKARIQVDLNELSLTGGDINVDETLTDPSAVTIPVGGIEQTGSGASSLSALALSEEQMKAAGMDITAQGTPSVGGFSMLISKLAKASAGSPGTASGLITDIYDMALQNGKVNKDLTLTLAYNAVTSSVTDTSKLSIKKYNDSTAAWETVEGVTTITGDTISIDISTIASVSAAAIHASASNGTKYAVFYTVASTATTTNSYTGADIKVYNFPNPFDLTAKTVALADANAVQASISGTMLKLSLPLVANNAKVIAGSNYKYEIYNIAGELVRIIDLGIQTPGTYIYQEWDGKNDNDEKCASGVYLLLIRQGTTKLLDKAVKMAIIK
jgi:hypothetical protein